MRAIPLFLYSAILLLCNFTQAAQALTLEELCTQDPQRIEQLFEQLDLSTKELHPVQEAVTAQDWPKACRTLLAYYKEKHKDNALQPKPKDKPNTTTADEILRDHYTFYRVSDTIPRLEHGGLDWTFQGHTQDPEWAWGLNRQWYLSTLLNAYTDTGDHKYIRYLDALIIDWVLNNPYPGNKTNGAQWRGLETAHRSGNWGRVFAALQDNEAFSPAALILILTAIPNHAHYSKNFHATHGNWLTMEMNGLAGIAANWPEYKESAHWYAYTVEQMSASLLEQTYPDGVQKELSASYHRVAASNFERFADLAEQRGHSLPLTFRSTLESLWNYLAYSVRPTGHIPLNNDSDLDHIVSLIQGHAQDYQRPDWHYIVTHGKEGTHPELGPSIAFPWAGQAIFRSGWENDALWSLFDFGPTGIAHKHYDKLHLSIQAYGRDLLVDSGRYSYVRDEWRNYFTGTASHNTLLVDGANHKVLGPVTKEPMDQHFAITDTYAYARGEFTLG